MASQKYCEPCKKLLRGDIEYFTDIRNPFIHHIDADSFHKALELPCEICSLAWNGLVLESEEGLQGVGACLLQTYPDKGWTTLFFQRLGNEQRSKLCVFIPWEEMNQYQITPLPSPSTRSTSALEFLVHKYNDCREKHPSCRLRNPPPAQYPSRLIDLKKREDIVCVLDTAKLNEQGLLYACLSHCWGQKQPFTLKEETRSTLYAGIDVSCLPKTFRDAIFVVRLLGIQYLWIDSLCILQDSKDDWASESARMGDIYSQAACTIAASAAENSDCGLFFDRIPETLLPRRVDVSWSTDSANRHKLEHGFAGSYRYDIQHFCTQDIEHAPLNLRAWVCQERHLSPRIMHFTARQLFWECHQEMACETYPSGLPAWAVPDWFDNTSPLKRTLHEISWSVESNTSQQKFGRHGRHDFDPEVANELYFKWAQFRIYYTKCAMTKEEDKLVAIHGVAQQFGQVLGDRLVAGLWYNRFLEELCWFKHKLLGDPPISPPTIWRAPTWSWACSDARIWVSNTMKFHRRCPQRQIWGKVETLDVKSNASGQLEHASLQMRSRLVSCTVVPNDVKPNVSTNSIRTLSLANTMAEFDVFKSSLQEDQPNTADVRHFCVMILQRCAHSEDSREPEEGDCVEGLMLYPTNGSNDVFERVGLITIQGVSPVSKILKEYETVEDRIITLV